ncbi:MAG: hypothetical protein DNFNHJIP_00635 [Candidatus Argoarchaeum ethanivorans]|uniref:Uncharacterized protein n=1 Tax=Candidatus Argoarchaeum ethanivorans TaxID=2608793 RepID=A0A812A0Z8_9EURY|nr:MAG: hypothetical protein DNFNHJIP_00635 [Candidatus Argoarchaeum ethanivorans]
MNESVRFFSEVLNLILRSMRSNSALRSCESGVGGVAGFAPTPKKNRENSTKKKGDGILLLARRYTPLRKYASYLYAPIYSKVRRKKMS